MQHSDAKRKNRKQYAQVKFMIPKGKKDLLKAFADDYGISVTQLVLRAVEIKHGVHLPRGDE